MTEVIWDGKYVDGKQQGPVRVALPFQTIETVNVNGSAQDRLRTLELFASGPDTEWRNRLIWGDKTPQLNLRRSRLARRPENIPWWQSDRHFGRRYDEDAGS